MMRSYLSQLEEARTAARGSILIVGADEALLHSQALLLSILKIPVQAVSGDTEVFNLPPCANFCLVILDLASLELQTAAIAAYVRTRWPGARILLLGRLAQDFDDPLYDDIVDPRFNPSGFIEVGKRLLKELRSSVMKTGDFRVDD
jgi:hypothetical protein